MRSNETLPLILLWLVFTSHGCSFGKRKMHMHRKSDGNGDKCTCATPNRYISSAGFNHTVDPHCECDSSGFGVVRRMSYDGLESGTIYVDLSSACVRCGMCMVIADEINRRLFKLHDVMGPDDLLTDPEAVFILRGICNLSFRHYGLREIDGERFISNPIPGDKFVTSSADGSWEKRHFNYDISGSLKNMCHEYLTDIEEPQLYRKWVEWCKNDEHLPDLEDIICRNELSSLRDCRGIDNVHRRHVPSQDYSAHVKLLAECHNCNG